MCSLARLGFVLILVSGTWQIVIQYFLYTRKNPRVPQKIDFEPDLDTSKPTVIIIHGYLGAPFTNDCIQFKDAFLKKLDCNVILFDWSLNVGTYVEIVPYVIIAGKILGDQINDIFNNNANTHIVGLGMGAQLAAFAGKQVRKHTSGSNLLWRISAIDPLLPQFNISDPNKRLDKSDAQEVIVYHCDGNNLAIGEPIGTVDFYINGGMGLQPGCNDTNPSYIAVLNGDGKHAGCSHAVCRVYFHDYLNGNTTFATKCDSYESYNSGNCSGNEQVIFGDNVSSSANGTYFVNITGNGFYIY